MMVMGVAFSLVPAVLWPSVALIVEDKKLGTAYGLMTMIQNIGLFSFNLLIGLSNDVFAAGKSNPSGYSGGMWMFSTLGFFAVIFTLYLKRSNKTLLGTPGVHDLEKGTSSK
jgi:MFS family permease